MGQAAAGNVDLTRGAMKIGSGVPLEYLSDPELKTFGYERKTDEAGRVSIDPMTPEDLVANGLEKPLLQMGADGKPVITDAALARVGTASPRALSHLGTTEADQHAAAQQRADDAAKATAEAAAAQDTPGGVPESAQAKLEADDFHAQPWTAAEVDHINAIHGEDSPFHASHLPEVVAAAFSQGLPVSRELHQRSGLALPADYHEVGHLVQQKEAVPVRAAYTEKHLEQAKVVAGRVRAAVAKSMPGLRVDVVHDDTAPASGGVVAHSDGRVEINLADVAATLARHGSPKQQEKILKNAIVRHEALHIAQYGVVRRLWEAAGSKGDFGTFFSDYYRGIGKELRAVPKLYEWAKELYDGKPLGETGESLWDNLQPHQQDAEVARMVLEEITKPTTKGRQALSELFRAEQNTSKFADFLKRVVDELGKWVEKLTKGGAESGVSDEARAHLDAVKAFYDELSGKKPDAKADMKPGSDAAKPTGESVPVKTKPDTKPTDKESLTVQPSTTPASADTALDELHDTGVAYFGDARFAVLQGENGQYYVLKTINGKQQPVTSWYSDIEGAQRDAVRQISQMAKPPEVSNDTPASLSIGERVTIHKAPFRDQAGAVVEIRPDGNVIVKVEGNPARMKLKEGEFTRENQPTNDSHGQNLQGQAGKEIVAKNPPAGKAGLDQGTGGSAGKGENAAAQGEEIAAEAALAKAKVKRGSRASDTPRQREARAYLRDNAHPAVDKLTQVGIESPPLQMRLIAAKLRRNEKLTPNEERTKNNNSAWNDMPSLGEIESWGPKGKMAAEIFRMIMRPGRGESPDNAAGYLEHLGPKPSVNEMWEALKSELKAIAKDTNARDLRNPSREWTDAEIAEHEAQHANLTPKDFLADGKLVVDAAEAAGYATPDEFTTTKPTEFEHIADAADDAYDPGEIYWPPESSVTGAGSGAHGGSPAQDGAGSRNEVASRKTAMDAKNLAAAQDFGGTDFKLTQDTIVDPATLAAEKAAAEDAKAQQDRQQLAMDFSGETPPQPATPNDHGREEKQASADQAQDGQRQVLNEQAAGEKSPVADLDADERAFLDSFGGDSLMSSPASRDKQTLDLFDQTARNAPQDSPLSRVKVEGTKNALGAYKALTAKREKLGRLSGAEEQTLLEAEQALGQRMAFDMLPDNLKGRNTPLVREAIKEAVKPSLSAPRRTVQQGLELGPVTDKSGQTSLFSSPANSDKFRDVSTLEDAKRAASSFVDQEITNIDDGLTATVSARSVKKMANESAVEKSMSPQAHAFALANLDHLFENSVRTHSGPDENGDINIAAMHRYWVPFPYHGQIILAKLTVKEFARESEGRRIYSVEAVDVVKPAGISTASISENRRNYVAQAGSAEKLQRKIDEIKGRNNLFSSPANEESRYADPLTPAEMVNVMPAMLSMVAKGKITDAESLAALLAKGGKERYSQSLWKVYQAVTGKDLATPDWAGIYKPKSETPVAVESKAGFITPHQGKLPSKQSFIGDFRLPEMVQGAAVGSLYKMSDGEYQVFVPKEFGQGESIGKSAILSKDDFHATGGLQVSASRNVREFSLKPKSETGDTTASDADRIKRHIATLEYRMKQDKAAGRTNPENVARLAQLNAELKSAQGNTLMSAPEHSDEEVNPTSQKGLDRSAKEADRVFDEHAATLPAKLSAQVGAFRESARTLDSQGSGSGASREETMRRDVAWAKEAGRLIPSDKIDALGDSISNETSEHEVWSFGSGGRAVKRTWPGVFGQVPVFWQGKILMKNASLPEYLRRMTLQSSVFGSDIRFEGVATSDKPSMLIGHDSGEPSAVISQEWIDAANPGNPHPSESQIVEFMQSKGFSKIKDSFNGWARKDGVIVMDAKPDNFIMSKDGVVPIDLQMGAIGKEQVPRLEYGEGLRSSPTQEEGQQNGDRLASAPARVEAAAAQTDTDPTPAQIEAGNYAKGKVTLHGMTVSIENPHGSTRSGTDKSGKPWSVEMNGHYGYFLGTEGRDKQHVDAFIGPDPASTKAFVINQIDPEAHRFDEHKVMLGYGSRREAIDGYKSNYAPGWKGLGDMVETNVDSLREWLKTEDTKKPARAADFKAAEPATSLAASPTPAGATPATATPAGGKSLLERVPGMESLKAIKDGIQTLLLPGAVSKEHLKAAETLGSKIGPMHQRAESINQSFKEDSMDFLKLGAGKESLGIDKNPGIQFMSARSTGRPMADFFKDPATAARMEEIRNKMNSEDGRRIKLLEEAGTPLQSVRENYFPGVWTKESREAFNLAMAQAREAGVIPDGQTVNDATPEQKAWVKARVDAALKNGTNASGALDALGYLTKTPLHGKQSFRKEKVFDEDIKTAFEFGLRPTSANPVDLVKLKWAEMDRSIMAAQAMQDWQAQGKMRVVDPFADVPKGWVEVPDRYGKVYGPPTIKVPEYVNKIVYQGLMKVAANIGLTPERRMAIGGSRLGYASKAGATVTKFATDMGVLAHEIGHQLDFKYDLWDRITGGEKGSARTPTQKELRDLADLTWEGSNPSDYHKRYTRKKEEKMAHLLEAYINARGRFQSVAPEVFGKFDSFVKSTPELASLAAIKGGISYEKLTGEKYLGLVQVGKRIVPKEVGDVLNNYLSRNLYNNPYFGKLYTGWTAIANALNQAQLGVGSAFHAGFTTGEAIVSANANVLKDVFGVMRGNRSFKDLAKTIGNSFIAPVETYRTGDKVLNAWREPDGTIDPKIAQVVRAAELAGAGFTMERGLATEQFPKMVEDWYSEHRIRAAARSPIAALELMAHPIMKGLVPRQKAGVFAHLANRIIEMNPGKTLEELTPEFRQAWNRIDARLGQVRYDRLFIENTAKNVVQGLVRAPGWTGGTLAELGGSFKDSYKFMDEWARTGRLPDNIPDRFAYTASLLLTVGLTNAMLTYLFTGDKPKDSLDYFAFRTGQLDDKGHPERMVLPTYMKDLLAYKTEGLQTLINKAHPLLSVVGDLYKNRDYYGVEVRHEDDGAIKQLADSGKFFAKAFEPFWIRGMRKEIDRKSDPSEIALPWIGIMPATRKMTQSPAERLAEKFAKDAIPQGARTQKQADASLAKGKLVMALRKGEKPDFKAAIADGTIKRQDIHALQKRAKETPLAYIVSKLTLDKAEAVYHHATTEERAQLHKIMVVKRRNQHVSTQDAPESE